MAPLRLSITSLLFFLFFSFSLFGGSAPADLASDRAALLAFRAAVRGVTLWWNTSDPSPCSWDGVTCSDNRVTELRLPGADLVGRIPPGTVGNLTALTALSLRYNLLFGTFPQDFTALARLQLLHVQNNRFSGEIPPSIFALRQLVRLNLGGNLFHGLIPQDFNNLTSIYALLLDHNRLSGEIPDLRLPNLFKFNVSFNHLEGPIPSSLRGIPASSFVGNSLCGGPLAACPGENSMPAVLSPLGSTRNSNRLRGSGRKNLSAGEIAGIAIGAAVGFLILLLLLMVLWFRVREEGEAKAKPKELRQLKPEAEMALRGKRDTQNKKAELPSSAAVPFPVNGAGRKLVFTGKVQRIYDLEDLLRASAEVLGKGTTGTTYKAMLEMGMVVAVKRLRDVSLSEKEFRERMDAIGAMDHPNLVALQAYYYSKDEKLLVYEIVPNGSLSALLHGNKQSGRTPLDWETRLEIALGAARGIEFIHLKGSDSSHGNIKSSNIVLSSKTYVDACVSDFGLSSLGSVSMPYPRAPSYRAPEVTDVRRVSQKADVYSFGVLLIELLTAKPPTQAPHGDDGVGGVDLPRWVQSVPAVDWSSEVFDVELSDRRQNAEPMVQLMLLAFDCAAQVPDSRPSMSEVVARIEEICMSCGMRDEQGGSANLDVPA